MGDKKVPVTNATGSLKIGDRVGIKAWNMWLKSRDKSCVLRITMDIKRIKTIFWRHYDPFLPIFSSN
jgi:hypothetical protein